MSLFERLKSAVKGNPVLREYDLGQQIASAGPGLFWRVYQGVKKTTRKDVAVFIFDKKSKEFDKLNKRNRDLLLEIFKSGPLQLSRLRHPRLLTVDHPLEESNDILAFTTEPISACLANVLGDHSNFQSAVPTEVKDIQLSPLEVKYGLLHVVEAISFLHADAKLVHGNLNPNCIFLDSVGRWKVGGFEFCHSLVNSQEMEVKEWSTKQPAFSQPLLNFTAPEYIITKLVSRCSDMFSYAMLAFVAYNGGRVLYDHRNNLSQYSKNIEWVSRIPLQSLDGVPDELKENVKAMLCIEPAVRPQACDLAKSSFFTEDPQVSTLMYLDNLYEKPELEKSQFFKVLPKIVSAYPKRILLSFVLPPLKVEFMDKRMIPFLLPTIFLIAEGLSSQEFALHILPLLVPVFKMQEPVQIQLILLQRMDLLLQKTSAREIREHIVPLIHTSLQSSSSKVQVRCCMSEYAL
jgi:SCY1-like protein 2